MKFKHSKEFTIGLSVIIAVIVLFFGIEYLKGSNIFKPTNYYTASYTNVAGLSQSAPVTINGYKVGLVSDIRYEYDNPGHITVEMSLNKELRIPKGSKAVLVTDMLGTSSIELQMESGTNYYNVGDVIIGERSAGLMSDVTNDLLPTVSSIMPKIDTLITSLNAIASSPALKSSIEHLDNALANIEAGSVQLNAMMAKMPAMANDASATMANAKTISEDLSTIAGNLSGVSNQLKDMPLQATVDNIAQTSESLRQLMAKLNSPESSLGLMLNDTGLYNNLNAASASLDSLLRDVKKNPKRYISIKLL